VAAHPSGNVYVIVDVPPDIKETIPEVLPIVATEGLELVHVPPVVALLSVDEPPAQPDVVPVIEVDKALTVKTDVD
jgi:hypothetical protein